MEEIVWEIRIGKLNIRWKKRYVRPFIQKDFCKEYSYFSIGKLAFVVIKD